MASGLAAYDFVLPSGLIAQTPLAQRDAARLLVVRRGQPGWAHHRFSDLPDLLPAGAILVCNNTRVIPARLKGERAGGGAVEALLVDEAAQGRWRAMVKPARRLKPGQGLRFADGAVTARCVERTPEGYWLLAFDEPETFRQRLESAGETPLPPYIQRQGATAEQKRMDRETYQTVYASRPGAVAAPTAGLHFTAGLLRTLADRGFERVELTLHVGPGTFTPIQVDDPAQHRMHAEAYEVPAAAARRMRDARAEGRPIVAVGTTSVRSLEAWARQGFPPEFAGATDLFIFPPFEFLATDGMITNFHLPRSTLLMLVAAFHGRERVLAAYEEAVQSGYRFFSYGDAMLVLP
jgi:S-adenosylmethionine:tRNA ribosyltransferase-isomerase